MAKENTRKDPKEYMSSTFLLKRKKLKGTWKRW